MAFEKGKSGNPKGRPKSGTTFKDLLEKELSKKDGCSTKKQKMMEVLYRMAAEGNLKAIMAVMERIDGKPVQPTEVDVSGDLEVSMIKIVSE